MKTIKTITSLLLVVLFQVACSTQDDQIIRGDQNNQVELDPILEFLGTYNFYHAGNSIPFDFTENSIVINMADMTGSGQENEHYEILAVYQNISNKVKKVVTKQQSKNIYKAFFLSDQDLESFNFNMDATYNFENLAQAIQTNYPQPNTNITIDHNKGIYGWIKLTKQEQKPEEITLPVNGKYEFSAQGFTYFYHFTNTKVNFNDSYSMQILAHNTSTNKILLKGIDPGVENSYYVIQLENITKESVQIARKTYNQEQAKAQAEAEFASKEILEANFSTYISKNTTL